MALPAKNNWGIEDLYRREPGYTGVIPEGWGDTLEDALALAEMLQDKLDEMRTMDQKRFRAMIPATRLDALEQLIDTLQYICDLENPEPDE